MSKTLCHEILAFGRACEYLLSKETDLTKEERDLLHYYINDLVREFPAGDEVLINGRAQEGV